MDAVASLLLSRLYSASLSTAMVSLTRQVASALMLLRGIDASGIDTVPAVTLNDAQPDSGQQFGRAVTTMPFNGGTALIVTANNEVYAYVRLSPLYDDLRQ